MQRGQLRSGTAGDGGAKQPHSPKCFVASDHEGGTVGPIEFTECANSGLSQQTFAILVATYDFQRGWGRTSLLLSSCADNRSYATARRPPASM